MDEKIKKGSEYVVNSSFLARYFRMKLDNVFKVTTNRHWSLTKIISMQEIFFGRNCDQYVNEPVAYIEIYFGVSYKFYIYMYLRG